jgi:hypothetical protein
MATIERPKLICELCFDNPNQSGRIAIPGLDREFLLWTRCPHNQSGAIGCERPDGKIVWSEQTPITDKEFAERLETITAFAQVYHADLLTAIRKHFDDTQKN